MLLLQLLLIRLFIVLKIIIIMKVYFFIILFIVIIIARERKQQYPNLPTIRNNYGHYEIIQSFTRTKYAITTTVGTECFYPEINTLFHSIAYQVQSQQKPGIGERDNFDLDLERNISKSKALTHLFYRLRHGDTQRFCFLFAESMSDIMVKTLDFYYRLYSNHHNIEPLNFDTISFWFRNRDEIENRCKLEFENGISGIIESQAYNISDGGYHNLIQCMRNIFKNATFLANIERSKTIERELP